MSRNPLAEVVAPLEWQGGTPDEDGYISWYAPTPFGGYRVEYNPGSEDGSCWSAWKWGYCFCDYYDEDDADCDDADDGKAKAWAHWLDRIGPALIAPSPTDAGEGGGT